MIKMFKTLNMDANSTKQFYWADDNCSTQCEETSQSKNLDWDALAVALTRLDHSPQNFKASVGRSGALGNRRPPSRSSRTSSQAASRKSSSAESIFNDFAGFEEDFVTPKVVNIEVRLEGADDEEDVNENTASKVLKKDFPSFEYNRLNILSNSSALERRKNYNLGLAHSSSTPLLNICNRTLLDSDTILQNIKNSYLNLRENKSDVYLSSKGSNFSISDRSSECSSKFPIPEKEGYDNVESSSETEVIISDRESIAESGIINRKTVIKINEKSKSASHLGKEETKRPHWLRELQERRLQRTSKDSTEPRIVPIDLNTDFSKGINVSIRNKSEDNLSCNRDSTSRMYVRQSDCENRPTRASAFNVRRTIEKRQIQQERRERKALREQLREHLRSLSEGRERKESTCSGSSATTQSSSSVRSKSLNSLNQEDEENIESTLFKVQSSPTLECEKNEVRSYLFGSNLSDSSSLRSSKLVSRIMSPSFSDIKRSESWKSSELKHLSKDIFKSEIPDDPYCDKVNQVEHKVNTPFNQSNCKSPVSNFSAHSNTQDTSSILFGSEDNLLDSTANSIELPDSPIPPPRRRSSRVSRSTGQLTVEQEAKPAWLRLAKERRSLRSQKQLEEQFSDRASSIITQEPEWVSRARKKLESMNVCLTSVTDAVSVVSQVTESSSAWSRGGLDALEDLREEVTRISEELSEEASAKVSRELGVADRGRGINMIEYRKSKSREASAERQKVSFDESATNKEKLKRMQPQPSNHKDEVKFGDLKHDWGGVQTKTTRSAGGKHKEMRFGEVSVQESLPDPQPTSKSEIPRKFSCPDNLKISNDSKSNEHGGEQLSVMHFGDTPQDIFTKSSNFRIKSQSSSKFESIAGPDPTKMTAEELNQNVEEYDFPIPTGNEDATELLNILRESLIKQELVPEVISSEDSKPKPRSILKRSSTEPADLDIKIEDTQSNFNPSPKQINSKGESSILDSISDHNKLNDAKFEHEDENETSDEELPTNVCSSYLFNPYLKTSPITKKKTNVKMHFDQSPESNKKEFKSSIKLVVKEPPSDSAKVLNSFLDRSPVGNNEGTDFQKPIRRDDYFGRRSLRESSRKWKEKAESPGASPESKKKDIYHHKPKEVYLEIIDQQRHSLPASLEKSKNRKSLFEWEANQRQRIEDEERNRYNKSALKPVSSKIKDLVMLHSVSTLKSIFTKDKSSGYNGTVDGKEDILFQKIPSGNLKKSPSKEFSNKSMKSPIIIKKLLYPEKALEVEWLSRVQPSLMGNSSPKNVKNIPLSIEREAYSFNQRNIYIDDENQTFPPKNILPSRNKFLSQNLQNIDTVAEKNKINSGISINNECNEKSGNSNLKNINKKMTDTSKASQIKKEKLFNLINNLTTERENEKLIYPDNAEDDFANVDERSALIRRSFHEYPSRKLREAKMESSPSPQRSYDDQTGLLKDIVESAPKPAPRLYEKKKNRELIKPTDFTSLSPTNFSTPVLSPPRSSPDRQLKDQTYPSIYERKLNLFPSLLKEKENIHPLREKAFINKIVNSNLIPKLEKDFGKESTAIETPVREIKDSYSPRITMKEKLDKNEVNNISFNKLQPVSERERCLSPSSDQSSVFEYSRENSPFIYEPFSSKLQRERTYSFQSNSSIRSTPERESRPVSLSSILERDISSPTSSTRKLSKSEELQEITKRYRKERALRKASNDTIKSEAFDSTKKPTFLFGVPSEQNNNILMKAPRERLRAQSPSSYVTKRIDTRARRLSSRGSQNSLKVVKKQLRESHIYSNMQQCDREKRASTKRDPKSDVRHTTLSEFSKPRSKVVRKKSSLKKHRNLKDSSLVKSVKIDNSKEEDSSLKKDKISKNVDSNSERYESIRHKPGGVWTKTSVRRMRLESESSDKSSIRRENGKLKRERSFKTEASKALEKWAAGTQVPGKIVKKEGQKYSHQIEEEEKEGKKTSKAISRRIVRRGSRRLSTGGELVSETKEMGSSDPSKDGSGSPSSKSLVKYGGEGKDGVSRKLKTSTDGERYVTQSVHTAGGVKKFTTEGVDNKTTKSKEIIGGLGWDGERNVAGHHGEKIVVEHSIGAGCRPSTVVKKATSQSKFIITKTKKKVPNVL